VAASDYSYLVFSLEGFRWVLYVVKGKLGKCEDFVTGTMLDLKSMQEAGEESDNVLVSDDVLLLMLAGLKLADFHRSPALPHRHLM
jgi:hypothetical protein